MARPLRLEHPDGTFHVWKCGVDRADIVFDDIDREYCGSSIINLKS